MCRSVHPAIVPAPDAERVARLRFWHLHYQSLSPAEGDLACPPSGSFGEAIVAFPASFEGRPTETTSFLWSDSDVYLTWGRELFGWPTLRSDITLAGPVWDESPVRPGAEGHAVARAAAGELALDDLVVASQLATPVGGPDPSFVTMRRPLQLGHPPERTEAVLTTMRVLDRGRRFAVDGRIRFAMSPGHPLHGLAPEPLSIEVVDGVDCVVGDDVRVSTTC